MARRPPPETILGIDFGASFTDAVVLKAHRIVFSFSRPRDQFNETALARALVHRRLFPSRAGVTGRPERVFHWPAVRVNELDAIGSGAALLSKRKRALVVSAGTGTALVFHTRHRTTHEGGSGVGGGTIEGLAGRLLHANVVRAHSLARSGKPSLDLSVGDIVGGPIGDLPADATASNFGRICPRAPRADVAYALFNLVAETIAILASSAAKQRKTKEVVFVGRLSNLALVRHRLSAAGRLLGFTPVFVPRGELATAAGAAMRP